MRFSPIETVAGSEEELEEGEEPSSDTPVASSASPEEHIARLRQKIETLQVGIGSLAVTCSFGVAAWRQGDSIDRLLQRADVALYEAKLAGRNRVIASDGTGTLVSDRPVLAIRKSA